MPPPPVLTFFFAEDEDDDRLKNPPFFLVPPSSAGCSVGEAALELASELPVALAGPMPPVEFAFKGGECLITKTVAMTMVMVMI